MLEDVLFEILLIVVVGTGGGETFGRFTLCDWDIRVPPLPTMPRPGPDDWDIFDDRFGLGLILLLDMVVSLDLDVSVFLGRGGTVGGISEVSLGWFERFCRLSFSSPPNVPCRRVE
jgi:hypothetical protein